MSKFYDEAYKWSLYMQYLGGQTLTQLCDATGITDKPLREWFKQFDSERLQVGNMTVVMLHQRHKRQREILQRQHAELAIIQKTAALETIPEVLRIHCANHLLDLYGPNQICRTLLIRKSNLYYQSFRKPPTTVYEMHNQQLRPAIQEICRVSTKRIGAERIRKILISQGFTVGKQKILELSRELLPYRTIVKKHHKKNWQVTPSNLLARHFNPREPNAAWVGDITEIKTDSGTYYLCMIMDLFGRRVVAARLSKQKEEALVHQTFLDAFDARGEPKGLLFHSDQGSQYTAKAFRALLADCCVTQSCSAPGVPYDNAPMESFFASLKTEEIHRYRYRGMNDLAVSLRAYLAFYHEKRPHSGIGNQTPVEAEHAYYEKQNAARNFNGCVALARKNKV